MIKCRSEMEVRGIEIDLNGPQGNVFWLMGFARKLGRQLGFSEEHCSAIVKAMRFSNYEGAIITFEEFFGDHVTMYR